MDFGSRIRFWKTYTLLIKVWGEGRSQYLRAFLHSEQDDNDLTYFIVYHMKAIRRAISEVRDHLQKEQQIYRETIHWLKKASWMNDRQKTLLQHALKHPDFIYTIESHMNSHNIAYQTARTDLLVLAKKGGLEKIKSGRAFQFIISQDFMKALEREDRSTEKGTPKN